MDLICTNSYKNQCIQVSKDIFSTLQKMRFRVYLQAPLNSECNVASLWDKSYLIHFFNNNTSKISFLSQSTPIYGINDMTPLI